MPVETLVAEAGTIAAELPPEPQSGLPPNTHEAIYARIFRELRPRTALPEIQVQFRRWASANAQIKLENGLLLVRIADTLAGAPETVHEALAEILLCKLFRRPVPAHANDRYRRYLNRRDIRDSL